MHQTREHFTQSNTMEGGKGQRGMCSLVSFYNTKQSPKNSPTSSLQQKLLDEESLIVESEPQIPQSKPGWKAMPYILGNETMERLATFGIQANFMVYLMREYNMDQVVAANILQTWLALCNILPVAGAFIADAYLGKFRTIATASFATLMGNATLTLSAIVPQLHPNPCSLEQRNLDDCAGNTKSQMTILLVALSWLAVGTGGIRPCSIPFAIDQFDLTTAEGRKGTSSFYNWYYTTQTVIMMINQTLVVYIQDSISWKLGFGIPTIFMLCAIVLFLVGREVYALVKPQGSIFSDVAQVLVAAKYKRHLRLPGSDEDAHGAFYDPLSMEGDVELKLPLTEQFRCLNKAALVVEDDLKEDGTIKDSWRLCSIQHVEEFKCMLKILPIFAASIIGYLPIAQQVTFPISQALKMDRNLWGTFEMPAGSIGIITLITIAIFLPCYDRFLVPKLAKVTKYEQGLSSLQKIGISHAFGILCMAASGIMERTRRDWAISSGEIEGDDSMSVMWLAPQFVLLGFANVFHVVGHTEFYNSESPDRMKSIGNSLLCLTVSFASYLSSAIGSVMEDYSAGKGQPGWLDNDINKGRLEYFYFLLAGLAVLNLIYFLLCARWYNYKTVVKVQKVVLH